MRLFEPLVGEVRAVLAEWRATGRWVEERVVGTPDWRPWPSQRKSGLVMQAETAVELGDPAVASVAFLLVTAEPALVRDGVVLRVGPELRDSIGHSLPFGRVLLLAVEDPGPEGLRPLLRDLERLRYEVNLDGYMMRAASQQGREWSRISHQAVVSGFSLKTLGSALLAACRTHPRVRAAEVLFVTSSARDVGRLAAIAERAGRLVSALDKMAETNACDCPSCDYRDLCQEVETLAAMRRARKASAKQPPQ